MASKASFPCPFYRSPEGCVMGSSCLFSHAINATSDKNGHTINHNFKSDVIAHPKKNNDEPPDPRAPPDKRALKRRSSEDLDAEFTKRFEDDYSLTKSLQDLKLGASDEVVALNSEVIDVELAKDVERIPSRGPRVVLKEEGEVSALSSRDFMIDPEKDDDEPPDLRGLQERRAPKRRSDFIEADDDHELVKCIRHDVPEDTVQTQELEASDEADDVIIKSDVVDADSERGERIQYHKLSPILEDDEDDPGFPDSTDGEEEESILDENEGLLKKIDVKPMIVAKPRLKTEDASEYASEIEEKGDQMMDVEESSFFDVEVVNEAGYDLEEKNAESMLTELQKNIDDVPMIVATRPLTAEEEEFFLRDNRGNPIFAIPGERSLRDLFRVLEKKDAGKRSDVTEEESEGVDDHHAAVEDPPPSDDIFWAEDGRFSDRFLRALADGELAPVEGVPIKYIVSQLSHVMRSENPMINAGLEPSGDRDYEQTPSVDGDDEKKEEEKILEHPKSLLNVDAPEFLPWWKQIKHEISYSTSSGRLPVEDVPKRFIPLCPYFEWSGECFYPSCSFRHGLVCNICEQDCLDFFSVAQMEDHTAVCLRARMEIAMAEFVKTRNAGRICGICMENIAEKNHRFGILSGCRHTFCLLCIRTWRGNTTEQFSTSTARRCPTCRRHSNFVIPSHIWPDTDEEKKWLIASYKKNTAKKMCKYYQGPMTNTCPFSSSCFYKHEELTTAEANYEGHWGFYRCAGDVGPHYRNTFRSPQLSSDESDFEDVGRVLSFLGL